MKRRKLMLPVRKDNAETIGKMLGAMADNWRSSDPQFVRAILQVQTLPKK